MNDKPHVLFLAAWYPHESDPMFGLFVQKHAGVVSQKYRVSVLHATYDMDLGNQIITHVTSGVSVTTVNISVKSKLIRWFYFLISMHKAYRHIVKISGKPSVNHVHVLTRMGVIALITRIRFGIPFVITEHWSRYFPIPGTYRNGIRKWLTRYICKRAKRISTISHSLATAMQAHGIKNRNPWMVVNNVVEENIFVPSTQPLPVSPVRFINVSCFEDQSKNLSGLIEALAVLADSGLSFRCVLAGTGQDFVDIQKLVFAKKLEQYIELPGLLSPAAVAEQMRQCHFYVQPSHYENMPVVISEALMCGLPVVATQVGGIHEMIDNQNGYLIEAGNPNELVSALRLMIENHAIFDRKSIRNEAFSKYSSEAVLKQFDQLYSGIIDD